MDIRVICADWIKAKKDATLQEDSSNEDRNLSSARHRTIVVFSVALACLVLSGVLFLVYPDSLYWSFSYAVMLILCLVLFVLSNLDTRHFLRVLSERNMERLTEAFKRLCLSSPEKRIDGMALLDEMAYQITAKMDRRKIVVERAFQVVVVVMLGGAISAFMDDPAGIPIIALTAIISIPAVIFSGLAWDVYDSVQSETAPLRTLEIVRRDLVQLQIANRLRA